MSNSQTEAIAYLRAIVAPIIDNPEELVVECGIDEMGVLLSFTTSRTDMGKVIGKQGATARSIRHLVRNFGVARQMRISLRINEPEGGKQPQNVV